MLKLYTQTLQPIRNCETDDRHCSQSEAVEQMADTAANQKLTQMTNIAINQNQ